MCNLLSKTSIALVDSQITNLNAKLPKNAGIHTNIIVTKLKSTNIKTCKIHCLISYSWNKRLRFLYDFKLADATHNLISKATGQGK